MCLLLTPAGLFTGCVSDTGSISTSSGVVPLSDISEQRREPVREGFAEALAHFSRGLTHEFREEREAAIGQFRLAIEKDPDNETLYLLTSRRLMDLGERDEALELMERWVERSPENTAGWLWISQLYLLAEREADSLEALEKVMELAPALEAPYLEAARLLLRQERFAEALEVTRRGTGSAAERKRVMQFHAELLMLEAGRVEDPVTEEALRTEALEVLQAARALYPAHVPFTLMQAGVEGQKSVKRVLPLFKELDVATGGALAVRNTMLVNFVQSLGQNASQAIFIVQAYLEENPDDPFGHFFRGILSELARRPDVAMESFERVVELDPGEVDAYRKLALLLFQGDEPDRALAVLADALTHHPEDVTLLTLQGILSVNFQKFERAAASLDRLDALRRSGTVLENEQEFFVLHATALLAVGRAEDAVEPMVRVAQKDMEAFEEIWRHQLALAFSADDDEALRDEREGGLIRALARVSDRLPEQPGVMRLLGRAHQFRREFADALRVYEETERLAAAQENPEQWIDADFLFDKASVLERLGRIEESKALFAMVIEKDPNHPPALNYLAYMWAERGMELEKALEYVQRALDQDPDNGAYIDTRGWIYFQMERYEEAYVDLKRASELEPEESVIAEHMGDVLLKLERPVEAVGFYRIALELGAAERVELVEASLANAEEAVERMLREQESAGSAGATE